MKKTLMLVTAALLIPGVAVAAPASPDSNPVLSAIQKMGAKLYSLGTSNGMEGWFIVKDGQVQIAYATPDNKAAIVGAMFGDNGDNVTARQVGALVQNNKEVADMIASAQKEQATIAQVGSPPSAAASAPTATGALPSASLSPGERLIHDLSGASGVVLGKATSPELLMVMDPRCPHCQATWKALHDSVGKGALHIRMIPIGTQDSENERAAAMLLGATDPLTAWDKYVGGEAAVLAGTPPAAALAAVRANHVLIDNWNIQNTPYLVYRAKDGKVKVLQGEPDKISAVLTDLGL